MVPSLARRARSAAYATLAVSLAGCSAGAGPPGDGYAEWAEGRPSRIPHREAAVAVLEDRLFVFGGFHNGAVQATSEVEVYDPATDTWSQRRPMPEPVTHVQAVVVGGTVWLAGGFVGDHPGPATDRVWRYDWTRDLWIRGPSLPARRGSGVLVRVGGALHFMGGYLPDRVTSGADHWVLDPAGGGSWRPAPALPEPRGHASAVELGGQLYVIGGARKHDPTPDDQVLVHRYDPGPGSWTRLPDLPRPLSHAEPSTFVADGRIFVVGGRDFQNGERRPTEAVSAILAYDPAAALWVEVDRLPVPLHGAAAAVIGDRLVVHGGSPDWRRPGRRTWLLPFRDAWRPRPPLPVPLGEVAAGVVGRWLVVVGEGSPVTLRFALDSGTWADPGAAARRPYPGHHHAAEVWGGRLYLFGGFGAEARTQIYDPRADRWWLGAPVPFAAGSSASAVVGDRICVAGGIIGSRTTDQAACYDPVRDSWTVVAPMPHPRNHAAAASDGSRMFVFGGRGPGSGDANVVANGYADVQVYDPVANTWRSSTEPGSGLAPLPQARGGMGKAVYLDGLFYVLGGETESGPGATPEGVYARVDIYDPQRNEWRAGRPMPVPRHGIFPVALAGRILVAGGGTRAGFSQSRTFDLYVPPAPRRAGGAPVSAAGARTP